jgi:hypothetical protein
MFAAFAAASFAFIGCSSDSGGTTSATDSGTLVDTGAAPDSSSTSDTAPAASSKLTGKLAIPADFKGEAVRVVLAGASALPLMGPPDGGLLFEDKAPKITPGGTYAIDADVSATVGKYYVLAIVYVKGGGTLSPKPDVDYDAATTMTLEFDGKKAVDMGTLTMALHHTGDGH